jgi:hypothetical protein
MKRSRIADTPYLYKQSAARFSLAFFSFFTKFLVVLEEAPSEWQWSTARCPISRDGGHADYERSSCAMRERLEGSLPVPDLTLLSKLNGVANFTTCAS